MNPVAGSAATWADGTLRSPVSGRPLLSQRLPVPGGDVLVAGDDEAWPVVDDIPFLRTGRAGLAASAVAALRDGDAADAAALLLTDQDPYAPDPPPSVALCRDLVERRDRVGFREAMRSLGYGRVGDYFAHRWTDPTFLSGLLLLEQALPDAPGGVVLELACGAGHFLHAIGRAGHAAIGCDLVFSKLWLARHHVSPEARLLCHDAAAPWPLADGIADALFCHDAFYFLPDKPAIAGRMRAMVGADGVLAVGHAHNAAVSNHSPGTAMAVAEYAALFPGAMLFDDAALTGAFAAGDVPEPVAVPALGGAAAISMLYAPTGPTLRPARRVMELDDPGWTLRLNPLYRRDGDAWHVDWPSPRYEGEYAPLATYPTAWNGPEPAGPAELERALRRRTHIRLPPRW